MERDEGYDTTDVAKIAYWRVSKRKGPSVAPAKSSRKEW